MKHGYRPDIDGLRAIAVLSVLLFHLSVPGITGGYVGVDVFFVISGFLITRIIRDEAVAGTFSFANFYERRARRIFPSLIAVLALSFAGATLFFSAMDMIHFAKSLMSTILFVSNVYFWQSISYFTADVEVKPLLHMWSLSVEEQFYFIWPLLLLLFIRKLSGRGLYVMLGVLALASLAAAIALGDSDPDAAFYLLPTRVYEFIIGAAVVWLIAHQPKKRFLSDLLFLLGLGLIGYSLFFFTEQTPFPSYNALIPAVGAALVIYAGAGARSRILLSNPVMVYIGLISYQLYLVHWPAFVYFKYQTLSDISDMDKLVIAAITFVISIAIYHGIDKPLRKVKGHHEMLNFGIGCGVVAVILVVLITTILRFDPGWQWRIDERFRMLTKDTVQFHRMEYGGAAFGTDDVIRIGDKTAQPSYIIFGDSYAAQYAHGLDILLQKEKKMAYALFDHACMIAPDVSTFLRGVPDETCAKEYPKLLDLLQGNNLPVIMAHSWHTYIQQLGDKATGQQITFPTSEAYYNRLIESIEKVRQDAGMNRRFIIVSLLPGAKNQKNISRCFTVPQFIKSNCASHMLLDQSEAVDGLQFNSMIDAYAKDKPNVTIINPYEAFCDGKTCKVISDSKIFYSDGNHLSRDGSEFFMEHYAPFFSGLSPSMPANDPAKAALAVPEPIVEPVVDTGAAASEPTAAPAN